MNYRLNKLTDEQLIKIAEMSKIVRLIAICRRPSKNKLSQVDRFGTIAFIPDSDKLPSNGSIKGY